MTPVHFNHLLRMALALLADRPRESVSCWCERELHFNEPDNRGPFTLLGREYVREPLDAWGDPLISDQVLIFGSQTGKTASIMGGAAWTIENDPARLFWVMPTRDVVRKFSRTRWIPMLKASPNLARLIPTGPRRYDFATLEQQIGNAIIDLIWSNSPSALASVPARCVILDEVDKFAEGGNREADAVSLAQQRTKNFPTPKRVKTTTPTLSTGLGWREFLKTDQRRRFLPCPMCKKSVVLAWSRDFTVFKPLTGAEAYVMWDKEAKRADGSWDLDRVERSARAQCPHCGGHILDGQKTLMDRAGEWRPTALAARGYRGWHLSSLYALGPETSFGKLAVKFLQAIVSLEGLQGFINGDLAEPWINQESSGERLEIIVGDDAPPVAGAVNILTVDYQETAPHFWYVVRAWETAEISGPGSRVSAPGTQTPDPRPKTPKKRLGTGHSRLIDFGSLDTWEELRAKQLEHKISDNHVTIDSGHAATVVYEQCLRWGAFARRPQSVPFFVGWTPSKGFPDRIEPWIDKKTKLPRPFQLGKAAIGHFRFELPLLEFNSPIVKDILERLRRGRTQWRWELCNKVDDTYFKHLDAEYKKPFYNRRTKRMVMVYIKRTQDWPDHLRDCEILQNVMAMLHELLPIATEAAGQDTRQKVKTA